MTVKLLSVTQLKAQAGKILDRALTGKPQYVVRDGEVLQITKAGLVAGVEDRPPATSPMITPTRRMNAWPWNAQWAKSAKGPSDEAMGNLEIPTAGV